MRNVLDLAPMFALKRLLFTSSVAACPFPPPGQVVNEDTPPNGAEPYSQSKRAGEELLLEFADRVPANILRLAAVFTDWCEYEPLTSFLQAWCSKSWNARVLGGWGHWAIPYIHRQDLVLFFQQVVAHLDVLEPLEVLQGSPSGSVSQRELYDEATRACYGQPRMGIPVPKPVARVGIKMREGLGRVTGRMPFERSWMGNYIDQRLQVDASRTHQRLRWVPDPERAILGRVPIMVQHMREQPDEWNRRQELRRSPQQV